MKNMKKNKHLHIQIFTVTRLNKYVHVFIIYIDKIIFFHNSVIGRLVCTRITLLLPVANLANCCVNSVIKKIFSTIRMVSNSRIMLDIIALISNVTFWPFSIFVIFVVLFGFWWFVILLYDFNCSTIRWRPLYKQIQKNILHTSTC